MIKRWYIPQKGNIADLDEDHELIPYTSYTFGDIEVYVLRVSHDATNPIGFIFSGDETLLLYDRYRLCHRRIKNLFIT